MAFALSKIAKLVNKKAFVTPLSSIISSNNCKCENQFKEATRFPSENSMKSGKTDSRVVRFGCIGAKKKISSTFSSNIEMVIKTNCVREIFFH